LSALTKKAQYFSAEIGYDAKWHYREIVLSRSFEPFIMVNAVFTLLEYRMRLRWIGSTQFQLSVLRGKQLKFAEANEFWKRLKTEDQLSLARQGASAAA
jgi:hypothetical protein